LTGRELGELQADKKRHLDHFVSSLLITVLRRTHRLLILNDEATIAEYLNQILADGNADEIIRAVGHVARARGMKKVAEDAGVGRASLYKALKPGAKPQFDTILKVIGTFGIRLQVVQPKAKPATRRRVA